MTAPAQSDAALAPNGLAATRQGDGDPTAHSGDAIRFDAVLMPHRSLPRGRLKLLIGAFVAANAVIGVPAFLLGAWPVLGFMGLDVLLLWWLFRLSYRDGMLRETLTLTERNLAVTRVQPDGDLETWRLDPWWLRVEIDAAAGDDCRLVLVSRGNRLVVGRFLPPAERLEVADALRAALAELRAPRHRHRWDGDSG